MSESLEAEGYQVRRSAYKLETTCLIGYTHGSGDRVVAFNAEYDGLRGIGCGHNPIATSAIAAFLSTWGKFEAPMHQRARFHRPSSRHPFRRGRRWKDPHDKERRIQGCICLPH